MGGLVLVGWAVATLSNVDAGLAQDIYKPTADEVRAAATTVPISASGCASFADVEAATIRAADATAYFWLALSGNSPTPAESLRALDNLRAKLTTGMRYARGPMNTRLDNVLRHVTAAEDEIRSWRGVVPETSSSAWERISTIRNKAYTELRIAERLLGTTCGGKLAPDASRVLFGPCWEALHSTTVPLSSPTHATETSLSTSGGSSRAICPKI